MRVGNGPKSSALARWNRGRLLSSRRGVVRPRMVPWNSKHVLVSIVASVSCLAIVGIATGPAAGATAAPAISVLQSTSSTGYADAGATVPLGFLVTNTGNATLNSVVVTDTIDSGSVPVTCDQTVLLPQATTTCNATYTATAGDVTAGSIASSAAASGTDYVPTTVTSAPSSLSVPAVNTSATPLLPTTLPIQQTLSSVPAAFQPYPDSNNPEDPDALWAVQGTECLSDGSTCSSSNTFTTCAIGSLPPTQPSSGGIGGVLCLGAGPDSTDEVPVPSIAVPTANVKVPVLCAWESGNFLDDVPCGFQAQISSDGINWTNAGPTQFVDNNPAPDCSATNFCWDQGSVIIPLTSVVQYARIETSGPTSYSGLPIQISVEPTARIQANVLLNRIVYQPPGGGSSQTYGTSTDYMTETNTTYGQTSSSISETNTSNELDENLSVGSSWATLNFSASQSWVNDAKSTNTQSNSTENDDQITTGFGSSLGTNETQWAADGDSPTIPPWENDELDVLVNPQFAVWDFASCSSGAASLTEAGGTTCPSGSTTTPSTGIIPTAVSEEQIVNVGNLIPCVEGSGTFTLSGLTTPLTQAECKSLVSQDPFAATALGLVPTPPGQSPGQAVNPALILGDGTAQADNPLSLEAGVPKSWTASQNLQSTYTYTGTSTMETDVTSSEANTFAVGLSVNVGIPDLFNISAGLTYKYGETSTTGQSLIESYTGSNSTTTSQGFNTTASVDDTNSAVTITPYFDPRFDTWMFETGLTGGPASQTPTPTITGATPVSLTLTTAINPGKVKTIAVVALPLGLSKGQELSLPNGQVLKVKKAVPAGATSVKVKGKKVKIAVPKGGSIGAVGAVLVTGTGLLNGPMGVSACTNSTTVPNCSSGTNVAQVESSGGSSLYADIPEPPGTVVGLVVQSQSGNSPGSGLSYTIPAL
jgi:uncharacterized repeat protein (TIGR01451 family)